MMEPQDDTLPLDFGLLEIDKKTEGQSRGSKIVETLRRVLVGETLDTFQLDHQHIFHEDAGKEFSSGLAIVSHGKRGFGSGLDTTKPEFCEQGSPVAFSGIPALLDAPRLTSSSVVG
jgi:hypothetical protein